MPTKRNSPSSRRHRQNKSHATHSPRASPQASTAVSSPATPIQKQRRADSPRHNRLLWSPELHASELYDSSSCSSFEMIDLGITEDSPYINSESSISSWEQELDAFALNSDDHIRDQDDHVMTGFEAWYRQQIVDMDTVDMHSLNRAISCDRVPRGWKDPAHEHNLRRSNPCKVNVPNQVRLPRGHKDVAHRRAQKRSDPILGKNRSTANKAGKKPSIQSIIQAIITREDAPSPRSPRNARAVHKALGLSSSQADAIAAQSSPRLRAKAVSAAVLQMRPLASCAKQINRTSRNATFQRHAF